MRALVTGGGGFIGSNLVDRLLAEGHSVDVVDNLLTGKLSNLAEARRAGGHALTIHNLDIRAPELVALAERQKPEVVFHLAAQSSVSISVSDPLLDATVNAVGTLNVLEAARAAGSRKVVYAASGGTIYGDIDPSDLPVKESHSQHPLSPYGVSKKAGHDYLVAYRELHQVEFTSLALANVYGPRQDPHGEAGVVSIFAARLLAGEPCKIFGDGEATRDYVFVDDVVDAFVRAASKGSGLLLNIGSGRETTTNSLYKALASAAGVTAPALHAPPRAGDLARSVLDPARAELHLGWKPWTSLDEGIAAVFSWLQRNKSS
jgi:UDP-glucose 4-epimerase